MADPRIRIYRDAALAMKEGQFNIHLPVDKSDEVAELGLALMDLGQTLERRLNEMRHLVDVTEKINAGLLLDEVLEYIYDSFRPIIPFNRIGFALIDEEEGTVTARWAKSDSDVVEIQRGYKASLQGSSLRDILESGTPRILNDLEEYARNKPSSESTVMVLREGILSSLTCPLIAMGKAVGFIFFSSREKNTYDNIHIEIFRQIAGQLATIVEKARLYQDLLELNQLKNRFLGIAAHDMRNPLTIQKGFISLFSKGKLGELTEKQQEVMKILEEACEAMLAMINDLLDVSAIESGKLDLTLQEVDLADFMARNQSANAILATAKSITLNLDMPDNVVSAFLDPKRITQVLNNLLSNAIKFSYPDSTITMGVRRISDGYEFFVQDQGQGIPTGDIPNLFTEFGKVSVQPTAGEHSTGLGLAIAKKMVDAHGGRVWVESEVGVGSTFGFVIPFVD